MIEPLAAVLDELRPYKNQLVPFHISMIVYVFTAAVLETYTDLHWIHTTVVKCAPTVCLAGFAVVAGIHDQPFSSKVAIGLLFSCAGDALLEVDLFPEGIAAFAVAHVCYIWAFGWSPLRSSIAGCLAVPSILFLCVILPKVDDIAIAIGLPIYTALLGTMSWRAIARVDTMQNTTLACFRFCAALGSVLFVISDALIAIDRFYTCIPFRRFLIMSTYYVAQLSIALTVHRTRDGVRAAAARKPPKAHQN